MGATPHFSWKRTPQPFPCRMLEINGLAACSESSSRREEALISLLFPRKFEPRYLGCYGKWHFSTGRQATGEVTREPRINRHAPQSIRLPRVRLRKMSRPLFAKLKLMSA